MTEDTKRAWEWVDRALILATLIAVLVVLAGCGGGSEDEPDQATPQVTCFAGSCI